jgi:chorismate mutase
MADERDVEMRKATPPEVDGLRRRIDLIDDQLMKLLNSRSACAVEIGRVKRRIGMAVYQPEREAWILERVEVNNPGPLDRGAVRRVFERIIDEGRRLERLAQEEDDEVAGEARGSLPPGREGD